MGTACSVCGAFRVQHVAFALIPLTCATFGVDNIDRSDTFSRQLLKLVLQLLNCYTFRNVKEEMISLLLQKPGLYIWDVCVCVCVEDFHPQFPDILTAAQIIFISCDLSLAADKGHSL